MRIENANFVIGLIALLIAAASFYFFSVDRNDKKIEDLCRDFINYGQTGMLNKHLDIFTPYVDYYGIKQINRERITKHFFPRKKKARITVTILNGDVSIDKKSNTATFTVLHEEFERNTKVFTKQEVTIIEYQKHNDQFQINAVRNTGIRISNFQKPKELSRERRNLYQQPLILNEKTFPKPILCKINGSNVNVRIAPSIRASKLSFQGSSLQVANDEVVELLSEVEIESSIEGVHRVDKYGFLILEEGRSNSTIYIVESDNEARVPNNEMLMLTKWYKIRLKKDFTGFIAPSLINCN